MDDPLFHIRPVRSADDLATTIELFQAYAASLGVDLSYQDFRGELAALPGKYAPPRGELFLARNKDGEPLGCAALRPMEVDGCCEIKRLYVAPSARGMGLGRALVDTVLETATGIGYRDICLDSLPAMIEAITLYRKAGFTTITPYYDTPVAGTVFLGRRLDAPDLPTSP